MPFGSDHVNFGKTLLKGTSEHPLAGFKSFAIDRWFTRGYLNLIWNYGGLAHQTSDVAIIPVQEIGIFSHTERTMLIRIVVLVRLEKGLWERAWLRFGQIDDHIRAEHGVYDMFAALEAIAPSLHWTTSEGLVPMQETEVIALTTVNDIGTPTAVKAVNLGAIPAMSISSNGKLVVQLPGRRPMSDTKALRDIILTHE